MTFLLAGCVTPDGTRIGTNPATSWQSLKVDADPGPDRILFDVAVIQRPVGDEYLCEQIWSSADEMIAPSEIRELLELNGLRIGILVGSPPEKLTHLLQSDRSCIERKGRSTPSGQTIVQAIGESKREVEGYVRLGKTKEEITVDRPHFGFDVHAILQPDESIRMKLTPRYEAGDPSINYKPVPEESKWSIEMKRPTRRLDALAFEVTLAPNQVLIIGPRLEHPGSFGDLGLVDDSGENQRMIVLRHLRPKTPSARADVADVEFPANPPLALQASR